MTMVERVARAICTALAHEDGYEGENLWPLDADGSIAFLDQERPNMLNVARAAIAAMRQIDGPMRAAIATVRFRQNSSADDVFAAAIDAALSEPG